MLSNLQKNIIIRAARIRMDNGEDINAVMDSYQKLTDEEKKEVMEIVSNQ